MAAHQALQWPYERMNGNAMHVQEEAAAAAGATELMYISGPDGALRPAGPHTAASKR